MTAEYRIWRFLFCYMPCLLGQKTGTVPKQPFLMLSDTFQNAPSVPLQTETEDFPEDLTKISIRPLVLSGRGFQNPEILPW